MYIAITAVAYPQRCAVQLLSDLEKAFVARCGGQVASSSENGLSHVTSGLLSELCDRFDDPSGVDTISRTVEKVESVKLIMQDNIETVLANTVQLEHIAESAESLNDQASMFKKNAVQLRKKMWWKKLKMTLLIVFVTLAVLTAIAVPIGRQGHGGESWGHGEGTGGGGDSPAAAPPPSPAPTTARRRHPPATFFARCLRGVQSSSEVAASDRRLGAVRAASFAASSPPAAGSKQPDARSPRRRRGCPCCCCSARDDCGRRRRQRRISCRWFLLSRGGEVVSGAETGVVVASPRQAGAALGFRSPHRLR